MDTKEGIHEVAMANVRIFNAITNFAGQLPGNSQKKELVLVMEKESAELLLNFGNKEEIIVGATVLSQRERRYKTEFEKDILTLQDALKRDGLSNEAKEAIERSIRYVKAKLASHRFPDSRELEFLTRPPSLAYPEQTKCVEGLFAAIH